MFAFLLCCEVIGLSGKTTTAEEWAALLGTGGATRGRVESYLEKHPCPDEAALGIGNWEKICLLVKTIPGFDGILKHMSENWDEWISWKESKNAHQKRFPDDWDKKLTDFQRLVLLRCLCPHHGIAGIRLFLSVNMGSDFATDSGLDGMDVLFGDMDNKTPCLFVLSAGTDPMGSWMKFAEKKGVVKYAKTISLGQGQGTRATAMIEGAKRSGNWILLQNVHLARSWCGELDRIVQSLSENAVSISPKFRLFLTSKPVDYFPVNVLQSCIKMTTEPPAGVKANMLRSFEMHIERGMLDGGEDWDDVLGIKQGAWKKLLYSLCMFHAVVSERRKFGSIGWNASYNFSDSDLTTGILTLRRMLEDVVRGGGEQHIPLESLVFMTGQIVYGGRVTDDWDRRCLMSLMRMFYNDGMLEVKGAASRERGRLFIHQFLTP